jgi:hypothetical protein
MMDGKTMASIASRVIGPVILFNTLLLERRKLLRMVRWDRATHSSKSN